MVLEHLAPMYYQDDWENDADNQTYVRIRHCMKKAITRLPDRLRRAVEEGNFHDMYIMGLSLFTDASGQNMSIKLADRDSESGLAIKGIARLCVHGDIVSQDANFPIAKTIKNPLAQILDIWFDYQGELDCVILLDNSRYICFRAKEMDLAAEAGVVS